MNGPFTKKKDYRQVAEKIKTKRSARKANKDVNNPLAESAIWDNTEYDCVAIDSSSSESEDLTREYEGEKYINEENISSEDEDEKRLERIGALLGSCQDLMDYWRSVDMKQKYSFQRKKN